MLIEKSNTTYRQCRIPGLVMTKRGTLLGYYECRNSTSDWADIDLKIIRSTDEGEHWEIVELIKGNGNTLNNPVMIVQGETIHFLYCKNYKQLFYCTSTDDGKNFLCKHQEITEVFEQNDRFYNVAAIGSGHGIVHNGILLIPVWFAFNEIDAKAHHPSFVKTIYSHDNGKSWHLGEIIGGDIFVDPSECALASTKDGVLISIRNENVNHQRGIAISRNGYENWNNIHFEPNLPDPICQGSMDILDNQIFHINCDSTKERENLKIKISKDNFTTIEKSILVDEQGGYSDIVATDEKIYVLYERNIDEDGLYFKKINYKNY